MNISSLEEGFWMRKGFHRERVYAHFSAASLIISSMLGYGNKVNDILS